MYNNLSIIFALAAKGSDSVLDKVIFAFDYVLLPLSGIAMLFIVYKLIKKKQIIINKEEETSN